MENKTEMQPIEFLEYSKQFVEYSERAYLAKHSKLTISKIYNLFNQGKGKKNALKISRAVLKLLAKKKINNCVIENYRKKFAN